MLPKSPKTIVEQLRARADMLDRCCTINSSKYLREIADWIEQGVIYLPKFGKEI